MKDTVQRASRKGGKVDLKLILLAALALVLLIIGGSALRQRDASLERTTPQFERMEVRQVKLLNDRGQQVSYAMRIAADSAEQQAGFQNIGRAVLQRTLILFVFPTEIVGRFHMRHVVAPLDIAFIASDGAIIDIERMEPDPTTSGPYRHLYGPNRAFQYAIEARAGFFKAQHISSGQAKLIVGSWR